jgi:hypothetical protein
MAFALLRAANRNTMPSIDLARLRKQALRLADFFFAPDEFSRNLSNVLDSYVNHTIRARQPATRDLNLPSLHTPAVVLKHIEQQISGVSSTPENTDAALALADRLWDEGLLETRLLAAFVLGCMSPEEAPLIARLTAWTSQVRNPELRTQLLDAGLTRMRTEAPDMFLQMLREWLRPERSRLWADAIRAALPAIHDPDFANLPALLEALEPVFRAAPSEIQTELAELVCSLYERSPTETAYLVRQVLTTSENALTGLTFKRMAPSLPDELQEEIREFAGGGRPPAT